MWHAETKSKAGKKGKERKGTLSVLSSSTGALIGDTET